jgi:anti-sigma factor RsiW
MDHREARALLIDRRRGMLDAASRQALEAHLADCEACRREDAADALLSRVLDERLPRRRAPASLHQSLEARLAPPPRRRWSRVTPLATMVTGAALAAAVMLFAWRPQTQTPGDTMLTEAVNDHLRVLYSEHPVEVDSGGIHQVKPWFEGRVDFAPVVPFAGDDDFPLQGGAVAYFLDRKAATFVFKRRLHLITLFVFRADGLPWPTVPTLPVGDARGTLESSRGFHVLLWRKGDLGYALVSDVDTNDLVTLGGKVAAGGS